MTTLQGSYQNHDNEIDWRPVISHLLTSTPVEPDEPELKSRFHNIILWLLILIGIALIFIGRRPILIQYGLSDYIAPVGQALFGSAVVGWVIDRIVQERFIREIALNTYGYLAGPHLPSAAKQFINAFIRPDFIISDDRREYILTPIADGKLKINVSVDYKIKNYGSDPASYTPVLQVEESENPNILSLTCYTDDKDKYTWNSNEIKYSNERASEKVKVALGKSVEILPVKSEDHKPYTVSWRYEITKQNDSTDLISFGRTVIGVSIRVNYDVNNMEVGIDEKAFGIQRIDDFNWKADTLFQKQQHIQLWWRPVKPQNQIAPVSSSSVQP